MGNGAFQTLIVAGLFLLIAAVIFLTVLVIRRGRGGAAAVTDYSRTSVASRPESGTGVGPDDSAPSGGTAQRIRPASASRRHKHCSARPRC